MADNPTDAARNDLDVHPTAPFSPTVSAPTMSHAEAVSKRDAMISDPAIREKILSGDVDTRHEWDRVIAGLAYGQVPAPAEPNSTEGLVDWYCSIAPDASEAHLEEIKTSRPISPTIRRRAEQWKEVHFRDPAFVQKYFDEDPEVRRQILNLNVVLSLPVRDQT